MMSIRNSVFISHGNPEDNELAGWLAARLKGAGYKVWIDLWHGKGHPTWEEIEEEIRERSIRVVSLVSKLGAEKPGFKDETNAACGVARDLGDKGFVVPVRLDEISYRSAIPIQLGRLNFIEGNNRGWGEILQDLLDQFDRDEIPVTDLATREIYEIWLSRQQAASSIVSKKPERIVSNWFNLKSLPSNIYFYSSDSMRQHWLHAIDGLPFPKRTDREILCTFAPPPEVRLSLPLGVKVKVAKKLRTESFLEGDPTAPVFTTWDDASRVLVDLIRQGFGALAKERGLVPHQLANRTCWYAPSSIVGDQRIQFEIGEHAGSRKLVGRHKDVFWHYASSIDVTWQKPRRITVSGHVLFSSDGEDILDSSRRAATLRRQAVRSKHNAWWRDVMLAYVSFLSQGQDGLVLPMGGNEKITIRSAPMEFLSPISITAWCNSA